MIDLLLLHPPALKPGEPPLGPAILAGHLRAQGFNVAVLDANLGAYLYLLDPARVARKAGSAPATVIKRAVDHAERSLALLRTPAGVQTFSRYATAVRHLSTLLSLYGDASQRLTLGDYEDEARSPFDPKALSALATGTGATLFHDYFRDQVLPQLLAQRPRLVAITVNFRHQALPAFELAGMIRRALPETLLVAGGGLITSWRRALTETGLRLPPFDHLVFGPGEEPLTRLARGEQAEYLLDGQAIAFAPDFSGFPLAEYLSPQPILPLAASRGCYWGKCRFCPEAAAPTHPFVVDPAASVPERLLALSNQTGVRHFHLTDNAIPIAALRALAGRAEELQALRWHGFVRFERALVEKELADGLARSGCTLLQLGLESGSQAVLDRMEKGTQLAEVGAILKNLRRAGIATYVYVMFGVPGETLADAELTRNFLEEHSDEIGFLNLALMNLPRDASMLGEPAAFGIASAELLDDTPLGLYSGFSSSTGWGRSEARRFVNELRREPAIRAILQRTPPWFTSNHAFFFSPTGGM